MLGRKRNPFSRCSVDPELDTIYSSPALSATGDLVFIGSGGNVMRALRTVDGSVAWTFGQGTADGRWQSSPVVSASGAVYFATTDSSIWAVNGSTGASLWSFATATPSRGSGALGAGGQLYFGADSDLVALDSATGRLLWRSSLGPVATMLNGSNVAPAVGPGGVVFMSSCLDELAAFDGATGAELWRYDMGSPDCMQTRHSSPSVGPGGLVAVGSNGMAVFAVDGPTGAYRWSQPVLSKVYGSPVIDARGTIFVVVTGGQLLGFDGDTGLLRWDFPFPTAEQSIVAIPALAPDATGEVVMYVGDGAAGRALRALVASCGPPGALACRCSAGAAPTADGSACAACAPGSCAPRPGSLECSFCEPGSFAPDPGAAGCVACQTGSFSSQNGSAACHLCPADSFADGPGQTNCTACPVGLHSGTGATVCVAPQPPPQLPRSPLSDALLAVIAVLGGIVAAALVGLL